jgi:UDP-N-acetylmuramoylalanine--D-glutamate ligase
MTWFSGEGNERALLAHSPLTTYLVIPAQAGISPLIHFHQSVIIPTMEPTEYRDKKVTIFGLGRYEHGSGIAAAKFFIDQGANLVITDLQSKEDLSEQVERITDYAGKKKTLDKITWHMGGHAKEDILEADLLVVNQAVPVTSEWIQIAKNAGIPVETEMSLFFKLCPAEIIGITGTRGKSTTSALIAHMLEVTGKKVHLGGNITLAALEQLPAIKKEDLVVLELSNFMLEYLNEQQQSPSIAVLLNVLPDHLSRYNGSMDDYAAVKEVITKYQTADDLLICNRQNKYTNEIGQRTKARVDWYDITDDNIDVNLQATTLSGAHNLENVLAAVTVAQHFGLEQTEIENKLASFRPLEGRIQFVDEIDRVTFINDTTSTTPVAAVAAIEALRDRPLILIAGGADKGLSFSDFIQELTKIKAVVWLPGVGTDRLLEEIETAGISFDQMKANDMNEAVRLAYSRADENDIVILSPACASFGLFKNEFDRGDQFNDAVQSLRDNKIQRVQL